MVSLDVNIRFAHCHFLKSVDYLMLLNLVKVYCLKSNP